MEIYFFDDFIEFFFNKVTLLIIVMKYHQCVHLVIL